MDLSGIIDSALGFLGGLADGITGFFTTRTIVDGQVDMNRDNQLSDTNRAFSRNAMLGYSLPPGRRRRRGARHRAGEEEITPDPLKGA